jgi:cytochrome c-type biogenesis protein CcmF
MIPEIGHFSLILALLVALVVGTLSVVGGQTGRGDWMALARPGAQVLWLLTAFSFCCLTYAFFTNDFSVSYVAQHSNSRLPGMYRIAGVWGGHEGSLLLWLMMLVTWMLAVSLFSRQLPDPMVSRVLGVLALVAVGFMLFMLLTSNPFLRLNDAPEDGRDLNPLLQDPGLVFSSADALHGVRWHGCSFCICHCGSAQWKAGCCLGALVATLGDSRMGVFDARNCTGIRLGLLRIGVGWLVVLGPS